MIFFFLGCTLQVSPPPLGATEDISSSECAWAPRRGSPQAGVLGDGFIISSVMGFNSLRMVSSVPFSMRLEVALGGGAHFGWKNSMFCHRDQR